MFLDPSQIVLGLCSGVLVGFTLGMFGGGGSVLAVPLMVYIVGVRDPHIAIGTSAFEGHTRISASMVESPEL